MTPPSETAGTPAAPMLDGSPLTITVATGQGWSAIRDNVRTWEAAAARVGGDVVVADGSGQPGPAAGELGARTTWLRLDHDSVFALRVRAYDVATGAIVAATEDHCLVPEDWGVRMVAAHRAHPSAAAVGGSVLNGATTSLVDWAGFFVVQAAFVAPIPSGSAERLNGVVNVSYKREALTSVDDHGGLGTLDVLHQEQLRETGRVLVADDAIRVVHDQHFDLAAMTALHFHAGRTIGGFGRRHMALRDAARLVATLVVPIERLVRYAAILVPRGHGRRVALAAPLMLWLLYAQMIGQLAGYALGPGDSPRKLQ